MKKITSGILIALMITIVLSGCGNRQKDETIEESSLAPSVEDSSSTDETEEVKEEEVNKEDTVDNTSEAEFDPTDYSDPDKFKNTRIVDGNLIDKNGHVLAKLSPDNWLYYAARIDSNAKVYDKEGNPIGHISNKPGKLG